MRTFLLSSILCAAVGAAAAPVVSNVQVTQDEASRLVSVSYTLSGEPAVVTVDFLTNGVSVGQANLHRLIGAVNREVEPAETARTLLWRPELDWPGHLLAAGELSAVVTAWPTNSPPDYMIVDIATGVREYYVSSNAVPRGITDFLYKTDKLPFRRIHAAGREWRIGSPATEPGHREDERLHRVVLTRDYYIGVYPVTQRQYQLLRNTIGSNYTNETCWAARPRETLRFGALRGDEVNWPTDGHAVGSSCAIQSMRTTLKGLMVDLPTEAQWEIACRVGTDTSHNDGLNIARSASVKDEIVSRVARYARNCSGFDDFVGEKGGTAIVGSYEPNAWGLYDFHGNTWEYVLDWYDADYGSGGAEVVVDPVGPATGTKHVRRGGSFDGEITVSRSAYRSQKNPPDFYRNDGIRLCIEL